MSAKAAPGPEPVIDYPRAIALMVQRYRAERDAYLREQQGDQDR